MKSGFGAIDRLLEALFFVFRGPKRQKMLVYFLCFLALQRNVKSVGEEGLEPFQ